MSYRRPTACAAAALTVLALAANPAAAQDYPNRNVTLVVGFAAGGVADSIARLVGQKLSARIGQPVVVENRGGAGGNIAAKNVVTGAADGYTILVTTTALAINETMYKSKGFAATDFTTLAISASTPEVLAVHPSNPAKSLTEFVAAAKGKPVNFGTAGVGSGSHIAAEYFFKVLAKVEAVHVPFQGGAPAINAAVGNQMDALALSLAGGLLTQIQSDKLKGLAVATAQRMPVIKDVPTYAEGGYAGFSASSWVGFFVPNKTDAAIVAKLGNELSAVVKDKEVQDKLRQIGFDPIESTQKEAEAFFKTEVTKWSTMVDAVGISIK